MPCTAVVSRGFGVDIVAASESKFVCVLRNTLSFLVFDSLCSVCNTSSYSPSIFLCSSHNIRSLCFSFPYASQFVVYQLVYNGRGRLVDSYEKKEFSPDSLSEA